MPFLIQPQRDAFEVPRDITYLNCAYMSPQARAVRAAGLDAVGLKAQPWNLKPADFFTTSNRLRELFSRLLGCQSRDVALVPSVSYGIGVAAANIPFARGQKIIVLQDQFPSNVYPWMHLAEQRHGRISTIPRPLDGDWTSRILEDMDTSTGIVALPACHWTDGSLVDLVAIGEQCQVRGIPLVIDATQSLGAMPIDMSKVKPAFLVTAGYKWLLGPYSLGYLYVDPAYQAGMPLEQNWITREGSENFAGLVNYTEHLCEGAARYDVGERSNFALVPMAIKALELLLDWGVENIAHTLGTYNQEIAVAVEALGVIVPPRKYAAPHLMGLRFPKGLPPNLANALASHHIYVSVRGDAIRVAPHLYNDEWDRERFLESLRKALV